MKVHLVDGTYELFRAFYGADGVTAPDGREVGATRSIVRSLLALLRQPDVTHVGVAFDYVIESFRNELFAGYKTGAGIEPDLLAQFRLAEDAAEAIGVVVWRMVEFEADDAMAAFAARAAADARVEQVVLCTPDKDMAQCVRGDRVVCLDRMRSIVRDETGVIAKFGVRPPSIPDWLALVGDTADGIPGIPRWGEKASAAVLAHHHHIERIPEDPAQWLCQVRGAAGLAANLNERRPEALLYRTLATLRLDVPLSESVDDLAWRGAPRERLRAFAHSIGDVDLPDRVHRWRD